MIESGSYTPETLERRRKFAEALLSNSMQSRNITHPLQGIDQLAGALIGGMKLRKLEEQERSGQQELANMQLSLLRGGQGGDAPAAPAAPQSQFAPAPHSAPSQFSAPPSSPQPGMTTGDAPQDIQPGMRVTNSAPQPSGNPNFQNAIASIESGGRYGALGPVTKTGDRAYGKYQMMGNNIGPWSQDALGRKVDVAEFLKNPELQDQIFNHRFGQYAQKYGPEGAAKAWFAGEGGMKNPNARDQLGTSVDAYARKFAAALGQGGQQPQGAPVQIASLGGAQQMNDAGFGGGEAAQPQVSPQNIKLAQVLGAPGEGPNPFNPPMVNTPPGAPASAQAPQPQPSARPPMQASPLQESIIQGLQSSNPYVRKQMQGLAQEMLKKQLSPQDYDVHHRPDGSIVMTNKKNPQDIQVIQQPGAADSIAEAAAKKKAAELKAERDATAPVRNAQEQASANIVTQDIDRAIKTMDSSILPTTGAIGSTLSNIGGTAARDVKGLIDTVKANAGFAELSKMRQSSPTGAALGNVTEKELAFLQATIGNLEQSQTKEQLQDNLRRVKNAYSEIIHGKGNYTPERLSFENQGLSGKTKSGLNWSVQ